MTYSPPTITSFPMDSKPRKLPIKSAKANKGSPTANPTMTEAIMVVVYKEFADNKWRFSTIKGMADCSAGAKN